MQKYWPIVQNLQTLSQAFEKCSKLWLNPAKREKKMKIASKVFSSGYVFCLLISKPQSKMGGDFVCFFLSFLHVKNNVAAGFDLKKGRQVIQSR